MRQLVQLQKSYAAIQELDAEVVCVFREEKDGVEGLKRSRQAAMAEFPLLVDLDKKVTGAYSPEGFVTYVIDKQGTVRAVLAGTKSRRPSAEAILEELQAIAPSR